MNSKLIAGDIACMWHQGTQAFYEATVRDEAGDGTTSLQEYIAAAILQHGGLRNAARVLCCDSGYLSRLASGEKQNPGVQILRRLRLRKVVTVSYKKRD